MLLELTFVPTGRVSRKQIRLLFYEPHPLLAVLCFSSDESRQRMVLLGGETIGVELGSWFREHGYRDS